MSSLESKFILIVFMLGFVSYFEAKPAGEPGRLALTPIKSPNYPRHYTSDTDETFRRSVEEGSRILITFTDFDIENHPDCQYDWVKIVDGDGTILLPKRCGSDIPDPITSKTNRITVEFHSDDILTGKGFRAEIEPVSQLQFQPLTSPNYGNGNYGNNIDKTLHRTVEEGSRILITFTDFDIEYGFTDCLYDWVRIVDGDGTILLRKSCGSDKPAPITSNTNRITVEFHSDDTIAGRGFKAEWKAVTGSSPGCKCGIPNRANRIVNGRNAEVNEYPWQVRLLGCNRAGRCWGCGGSLIDDKTVLTAAHCIFDPNNERLTMTVTVGKHYMSNSMVIPGQEDIAVERAIEHDKYNTGPVALDNDFAILVLARAVQWNKAVQPICLPTETTDTYEGRMATATGWGYTSWEPPQTPDSPDELQEVNLKVVSNKKCADMFKKHPFKRVITKNMLCTTEGRKGTCKGDSGGPLIIEREGETVNGQPQYQQVGVVSWGEPCATAEYPDVFGRVTEQLKWIKDNMHGNTCS